MPMRSLPAGLVAYDDVGSGPPLVLLHGFPLDRTIWCPQTRALAARARVIVPDLPGFGESPRAETASGEPMSIDGLADLVVALLDALGIQRAVVAGLSMGGYVALAACRRAPERIAGLGLLNTRMEADDDAARRRRSQLIEAVGREGTEAIVTAMLPGLIGKSSRRRLPTLADEVAARMRATSPATIVDGLLALRDRPDATGTVRALTIPTLLLTGDEDVLTPPEVLARIAATLPADLPRRHYVVPACGHLSSLERPAAVTLALIELLELAERPSSSPVP
jgi:pimeloyl-ACP methyl ester carboxylesterase